MATFDDSAVRSTASIQGHPLHPMLVPFPIAFLVGALVTDIVFMRVADPFWARASAWLIGAGLVMGALAAVLGLIDFLTIRRVRSLAAGWVHFLGNAAALLLSLWNLLQRTTGETPLTVTQMGLVLSAVVVAILLITGWLGGEMAFRHRIGVMEAEAAGDLAQAAAAVRAGYDRQDESRRRA